MTAPLLELKGIWKSFGSLEVLKDISMHVSDSEIVAIVGPSGAGKTTLLQIAGTLGRPDRGSVSYGGMAVEGMRDKELSAFRNANIGFVFQFHQLLPEFTAQENVALPAMIGGTGRKAAMERAAELLGMLGLGGRLSHRPAQLSGGERQRAAIARALTNSPRIVFADEPTGSLDSRNREEIRKIMSDLRSTLGQAFVIVTHDAGVSSIADRTLRMADGRICEI